MKSKTQKQDEAILRNTAYSKLTTQQKLDALGSHRAKRQREKLQTVLTKSKTKGGTSK